MGVTGFDGLFVRSRGSQALGAWSKEDLGDGAGCDGTASGAVDEWSRRTAGGPVVFAPLKADTDYFPAGKAFMLNLRVDDIDALLDGFRAAGAAVETRAEWDSPEIGRFARTHDREGNPVELWQPPAD